MKIVDESWDFDGFISFFSGSFGVDMVLVISFPPFGKDDNWNVDARIKIFFMLIYLLFLSEVS